MTPRDFAQLVLDMLNSQQRYFKTRSHESLLEAKQYEKQARDEAKKIVDTQLELTGGK